MLRRVFLLIVLFGLVTAGCVDREKSILMAAGSYGDLAVVVPDASSEPMVRRFLDRFNVTHTFVIREEGEFKPDIFPPERWDLAKGYKNVLLLVVLGDDGDVAKAARRAVSRESWQRMEESGEQN